MPSKSKKQKKFMSAAAHNPKFAKKAGISQSVAKEFHNKDRGKYGHKTGELSKGKPPPKGKMQGALFGRGKPAGGRDSANKREKRLEGKPL